jgi:peptidoglycan/xylan/chitin deacetylase (PgdA/CDA1 family)
MLVAVNFHYIRPSFEARYPSIFGLTPAQFDAQLRVLARAGRFVSAHELREWIRDGRAPDRAILITLDDGLREQYEHAWPVLQRLGIPALFFVNTAPIVEGRILAVHKTHLLRSIVAPAEFLALLRRAAQDTPIECERPVALDSARQLYPYDDDEAASLKYFLNAQLTPQERDTLVEECFAEVFPGKEAAMREELYMSPDHIRALEGSIGSHTHAHLALGLIDEDSAEREIELSLSHLTEWLGSRPFAVSYPYGSREICTARVGEMARAAGVDYAFTMERAANRTFASPHHLARIDCNDAPGGKSCPFGPEDLFDALPRPSWFPT